MPGAALALALAVATCALPVPGVRVAGAGGDGRAVEAAAPGATTLTAARALPAGRVFDDEFSGRILGTAWTAVTRPGDASNAELECYRPTNVSVGGGTLRLRTRVDASCPGYRYTSAMVQWRAFRFTYGVVTVRARLAGGTGPWPAIWLLGADCQATNPTTANNVGSCRWPTTGSDEIDIAEVLGGDRTAVNQQIHSNGRNPGCSATTSDVSTHWHTYGLVWRPGSMRWSIDGVVTCTVTQSVPTTAMFLIINTAVGGAGGSVNGATLPQTGLVDYVRVDGPAHAACSRRAPAPCSP